MTSHYDFYPLSIWNEALGGRISSGKFLYGLHLCNKYSCFVWGFIFCWTWDKTFKQLIQMGMLLAGKPQRKRCSNDSPTIKHLLNTHQPSPLKPCQTNTSPEQSKSWWRWYLVSSFNTSLLQSIMLVVRQSIVRGYSFDYFFLFEQHIAYWYFWWC